MSNPFENPKIMLGLMVVKHMDSIIPLEQAVPYDRRAAYSAYYVLLGLDKNLITYHSDMFLLDQKNNKIPYAESMKEINRVIAEEWNNVATRNFHEFMMAISRWQELIASAYPKLGLAPETGETANDDYREVQEVEASEDVSDENEQRDESENTNRVFAEQKQPANTTERTNQPKRTGYRFK